MNKDNEGGTQPELGAPQWIGGWRTDIDYIYKDYHCGLHKVRVIGIEGNFIRIKFKEGGFTQLVDHTQLLR